MSYNYPKVNKNLKPLIYFFMRLHSLMVNFFFVKRMDVEGLENVSRTKPIIFAATHANSFYDAIVLHNVFLRYVHALARGDAFSKNAVAMILDLVHILPIWRITEGKQNMAKNNQTFDRCHELLRNNQQVLIYPEGVCKNQTTLLPLKRMGTSGMALRAWQEGIDVEVVPVVTTYDSFKKFGKRMNLRFNTPLKKEDFDLSDPQEFAKAFTSKLTEEMEVMISHDFKPVGFWRNLVHYAGWVIHFPLFLAINAFVKKKFGKTVFFDSVWFGLFYLSAGIYWLLLILLACQLF